MKKVKIIIKYTELWKMKFVGKERTKSSKILNPENNQNANNATTEKKTATISARERACA